MAVWIIVHMYVKKSKSITKKRTTHVLGLISKCITTLHQSIHLQSSGSFFLMFVSLFSRLKCSITTTDSCQLNKITDRLFFEQIALVIYSLLIFFLWGFNRQTIMSDSFQEDPSFFPVESKFHLKNITSRNRQWSFTWKMSNLRKLIVSFYLFRVSFDFHRLETKKKSTRFGSFQC